MDSSRRSFIQRTSLALSSFTLSGCIAGGASEKAADHAASRELDLQLLRAVGEAVLPASALGETGLERAVSAFQRWVAEYDPVPELMHGYGDAEIRYGPPDPAPGWLAQLHGLELEAQRRYRSAFAALSLERRREILRAHVAAERSDSLPPALQARHVVVALLSHFYDSPVATDLCYRAAIGKQTCRTLSASPQRPASLAEEG